MPKNNKKKVKSSGRAGLNSSNAKGLSGDDNSELNADENASTISNASTNMSYQDELGDDLIGKSKNPDEVIEKIDNIDIQIDTCLDGLSEKGFKEREDALKILKKMFASKYLVESFSSKRFTLTESLLKCLKRGKLSEQTLAADVIMLTFIQLGYSSSESLDFLNESKTMLLDLIEDEKVDSEVRSACIRTLSLALFITNDNSTDTMNILEKFETLFSSSYAKGDGSLRSFPPKMYELHSTALSSWCLLLCIMPLPYVNKLAQKHVKNLQDFLKSPDVDMRIIAGETIAFLFELAQCDSHADLDCFDDEDLSELLNNLANDSAKYRSKKDKKQQRSSFRDILKTIEEGDFETQTIKFGAENLFLDNWIRRKQYETLRECLGPGMNVHLQENEFVRDLFDLGAPLLNTDSNRKLNTASMNHMQKTQFNREQFRNRTKSMNKKRENKDAVGGGTGEDDD